MTPIPKSILFAGGVATAIAAMIVSYFAATRRPPGADAPAPVASIAPSSIAPKTPDSPPTTVAPTPSPFGAVSTSRPQFDVVRVEPTGDTVVAGTAEPNSIVALMNKGEKVAEAKADSAGQFVILPPALKPGEHLLTLRSTGVKGDIESEQNVATSVPKKAGDQVIAALASPNEPTRLLNDAGKPSPSSQSVAIATAEAGEDGSFLASGVAAPGSSIRLYLNDSFVAPVQAGPDGKWSLKIGRGMSSGHYDIRADAVDPASGKVTARAAAPFDYPEMKTAARTPPAPTASKEAAGAPTKRDVATAPPGNREAAKAPSGNAEPAKGPAGTSATTVAAVPIKPGETLVAEIQSVTVERGDSLWRISRKVLGQGVRYTQIYEANATQIRDPNRIWPGQIFVAPKSTAN
jgi:nucleoid-associated protein YgaU